MIGMRIDYAGDRAKDRSGRNPATAAEDIPKVTQVINEDVAAGRKAGPFAREQLPFSHVCISPIGAVKKKGSSKVRVIHNLSHPWRGDSVNAGIEAEAYSMDSFGHAARAVSRFGKTCFLVKLDVVAAFKQIPVHPSDWHLLGFRWLGQYYFERVLPFGLRSSPRLWELYAAAMHHFIEKCVALSCDPLHQDRAIFHYVDDFLFVVRSEALGVLLRDAAVALGTDLGLPWAPDKTEGPTQCLTFLGIELDAARQEARLPASKLSELRTLLTGWRGKSHASERELQSLIGLLRHACQVVRPGTFFLRRLMDQANMLGRVAPSPHAGFLLPPAARADIEWWLQFLGPAVASAEDHFPLRLCTGRAGHQQGRFETAQHDAPATPAGAVGHAARLRLPV